MKTSEQLKLLFDRISKGTISAKEVAWELRENLYAFDNANYRAKITGAMEWAEIYYSPRKANRWGGPDKVCATLLQDIGVAADIARELQGS
jgi:hypothetical protein